MKKKIPKTIKSKSKKIGKLVVPVYTKDKELSMLPIDLAGNNVLPRGFKKYLPLVKKMIAESPVKEGIAYLTIHEKKVKKGESHRRGGEHIDGNYVHYLHRANNWQRRVNSWNGPTDWKVTEHTPITAKQRSLSYDVETGGMLIVSNHSLCKGYEGNFIGRPRIGGDCSHLKKQLEKNGGFMLKANTLYLGNSRFIHESMPTNKTINRVLVRITLPGKAKVL